MRSTSDGSSPRPSSPPNAFQSTFLASIQSAAEPLTASEADLAGPALRKPFPPPAGGVPVDGKVFPPGRQV
jgi:hypothetical protein